MVTNIKRNLKSKIIYTYIINHVTYSVYKVNALSVSSICFGN